MLHNRDTCNVLFKTSLYKRLLLELTGTDARYILPKRNKEREKRS